MLSNWTGLKCVPFGKELIQLVLQTGFSVHIYRPFGQMIKPFIDSMSVQPSGGSAVFPNGVVTSHQSQPRSTEQPKPKTHLKSQPPPAPTQTANHTEDDFKPFIFEEVCFIQ